MPREAGRAGRAVGTAAARRLLRAAQRQVQVQEQGVAGILQLMPHTWRRGAMGQGTPLLVLLLVVVQVLVLARTRHSRGAAAERTASTIHTISNPLTAHSPKPWPGVSAVLRGRTVEGVWVRGRAWEQSAVHRKGPCNN
jgi:hypothetical protein